jgi:Galactose binding lectin domain/Secretion system C-terminal sorting domain
MIKPILFSILLTGLTARSQVICGTAGEGSTLTLTAPPGNVFTSIEYASYGTPLGSCGSYVNSGCHAVNSQTICEAAFIGQNSASISADNGVFGDPCGGTVKWLTVQARYSTTLPLKLLSFTAQKITAGKVRITWSTSEETNTAVFIIERSIGGTLYETIGSVAANGQGSHAYSYISTSVTVSPGELYRLRMVDKDGKQQFSNILRINNETTVFSLSAYPNPARDLLTIISNKQEVLTVTSVTGQLITSLQLINGSQTLAISDWPEGLYILKAGGSVLRFIKN